MASSGRRICTFSKKQPCKCTWVTDGAFMTVALLWFAQAGAARLSESGNPLTIQQGADRALHTSTAYKATELYSIA